MIRKSDCPVQTMKTSPYLPGCRQHNRAAWERFYADFSQTIYRWVLFLGVSASSAEEITQEVFLTAYRRIDTCESEGQLKSWLFQITRKQAANCRRNSWLKRFWNLKMKSAVDPDVLETTHPVSISWELKQALRAMPDKQMEVLLLHDLEGFTQSEIAATLGVPAGTVASRLRHARRTFAGKWREKKND